MTRTKIFFNIKFLLFILIYTLFINQQTLAGQNETITLDLAGNPNSLNNGNHWKRDGFSGGIGGVFPLVGADKTLILTQDQDLFFNGLIGNLGTLNLFGHDNKTIFVTEGGNNFSLITNDVSPGAVAQVNTADGTLNDLSGASLNPKINSR